MRVWLDTLRAAWSVEPISIRSRRPFDEAVRRLRGSGVIASAPGRGKASAWPRWRLPSPVGEALNGHGTTALKVAALALGMTFFFTAVAAVVVFGHSMRPRQVDYLRSWITGALTVPYFGARRTQD